MCMKDVLLKYEKCLFNFLIWSFGEIWHHHSVLKIKRKRLCDTQHASNLLRVNLWLHLYKKHKFPTLYAILWNVKKLRHFMFETSKSCAWPIFMDRKVWPIKSTSFMISVNSNIAYISMVGCRIKILTNISKNFVPIFKIWKN